MIKIASESFALVVAVATVPGAEAQALWDKVADRFGRLWHEIVFRYAG